VNAKVTNCTTLFWDNLAMIAK